MPREEYVKYYEETLKTDPEDFSRFCASIDRRLPYSFRVPKTQFTSRIRKRLKKYPFVRKTKYLDDVYEFCRDARDDELYGEFISFLVDQTAVGLIQRQEIVSMIPVLLLDIREDSRVVDMCAAPGSKTKQILEMVGESGLVIANDQNGKRLNILVTETSKRPNSSLVIAKHDASLFPRIQFPDGVGFDRVLCDVPCSSDGTIRKSPNVLDEWNLSRNIGLFNIQHRILKRGCELVEEEGLVAYSTCSLNPIENECVVQKILLGGGFELVDFRDDSRMALFSRSDDSGNKLIFREGLTTWGMENEVFENVDYRPAKTDLGLEKCIRLYPHDQDTGGFFIAILRKKITGAAAERREEVKTSFPKLHFLSDETRSELLHEYSIQTDGALYTKTAKSSHINVVSRISEGVLRKNPKLKVIGAGYRLFEKSGLEHSRFYLKNLFYVGGRFQHRLEISLEKFMLLLAEDFVRNTALGFEHVGLAIVRVDAIGTSFCGYGNSFSFTLFMNKNLRKALRGLMPVHE